MIVDYGGVMSAAEKQRMAAIERREAMKTDRRQFWEILFYAGLAFVVGTSVGAFIAMSYVAAYLKESLR
jgi:pimeloyl-ACP methyl ester carboxylesterase